MSGRFKDSWVKPTFDERGYTIFGWRAFKPENLILGDRCDIGHGCLLQATYGIEIGEKSEIGPFSYICSWSTIDNKKGKVTIGKNTMIGAHSTVMPGITIGDNVVIGAYSFVNRDIPSNSRAFGIPIRVRGKVE